MATIGDYFFVEKGTGSVPISIYSIAIHKYIFKTYSSKKINVIPSDLKKNSTYIYFETKSNQTTKNN